MVTIEYADGSFSEYESLVDIAIAFDIHLDLRDGDDDFLKAVFDQGPDIVVITGEGWEAWAENYKPEGWGLE